MDTFLEELKHTQKGEQDTQAATQREVERVRE